ncbi:MAG: hypothetical protein M0R46_15505 [Candidatus Muirbacterium halophilum]|nr:hypothetical protein [Candidatus Muirbacterium halophilum]MCK9477322.1 hypothetical protein [Candidatus Muirbacterium halophilum]
MKNLILTFYSIFARKKNRNYFTDLFYILLFLFLVLGSYGLNYKVTSNIIAQADMETAVYFFSVFIDIFIFFLIIMAFLSTMIHVFPVFYDDSEILFLYSLPVNKKIIFFNRFIKLFVYGAALFITFTIGAVFSFYVKFSAPVSIIFEGILASIFAAICYVSIAISITIYIVSFFKGKRGRNMLISISAVLMSGFIILIRLARPEVLINSGDASITDYIENLKMGFLSFFPSSWIKDIFLSSVDNTVNSFYPWLYLVLFSSFFLILSWKIWQKFYKIEENEGDFADIKNIQFNINENNDEVKILRDKELFLIKRNWINFQQIWLFIGVIVIFIFNLFFLSKLEGFTNSFLFLNSGVVMLITASFIARLFFGAFYGKHSEIVFLKSLPIKLSSVVLARIRLFLPLMIVLSLLLNLVNILFFKSNVHIVVIFIMNSIIMPIFFLTMAGYFSSIKMKDSFSVFTIPVQLFVFLSGFTGFFMLVYQGKETWRLQKNIINLFEFYSGNIAIYALLLIVSFLFYKWNVKKLQKCL